MTENSLVVSRHGLSDEQLAAWFSEHACDLARCSRLIPASGADDATGYDDARLIELFLENEVEITEHRFTKAFPDAAVRRASASDQDLFRLDLVAADEGDEAVNAGCAEGDEAIITHFLGSDSKDNAHAIDVTLKLRCGIGGGTGARLWSGGLLMAEWLARGAALASRETLDFVDRDVLELGAGSAALPSVAVARRGARNVVATDLLTDVVELMRKNAARNSPSVSVRVLDWLSAGQTRYAAEAQFDVVLFADAIYTERGAFLLADAVKSLLRPGGVVVGSLPDFRVGIASFEEDLRFCGFEATNAILDADLRKAAAAPLIACNGAGVIAGGSVEGYRIVAWRQNAGGERAALRGKPRQSRRGRKPRAP